MVFESEGSILTWPVIEKNLEKIKKRSIDELLVVYNKFKPIENDPFKWGDEIELTLIKFDHVNKKCHLLLKSEQFFNYFNLLKSEDNDSKRISELYQCEFHTEYTRYIIEAIPGSPMNNDINTFKKLEDNMKLRKKLIQKFLGKDEHVISLTSFPLLGCLNFTIPVHNPATFSDSKYNSQFYSNEIIMNKPLFISATINKIDRSKSLSRINIPVFRDTNTTDPFVEVLPNGTFSEPNQIYMDHDGFAMGCCCVQVTFQASSCEQACNLYDQLSTIAPIMLALSASSPIWRGYLANLDTRWNVLKQAFDDRSKSEVTSGTLKRKRFDSTDVYISKEGSKYNDLEYDRDDDVFAYLVEKGMDTDLAQHFASMYIRDPFVVFDNDLKNESPYFSGNFEIFNCTNWRSLRFKPPPMITDEEKHEIGWRIEFRPIEIQFTDYENTALCIFVILLTRTITALNLNFLHKISESTENMERAQTLNSCVNQKFFFRKNIHDFDNSETSEMAINEIINGNKDFKGLLYYVDEYLNREDITNENRTTIHNYLKLIAMRASGDLMTPATWIRNFVTKHGKYQNDSKISEEINYDLIWRIFQIANGHVECKEMLP